MQEYKYILGISAFYHDSAACILRDGHIVAAAQEERFTRLKHDPAFPHHAVKYCLQEAGITMQDVEIVAFYDKPLLKFERILETYLSIAPRGLRSFIAALPLWMGEKLWMKDVIRRSLGFEGRILFPEHHLSHAASAFYPSPFTSAAVLTMDGVGEWATTSYGIGKNNTITLLGELRFPHSLGLLYSAFTYYCGFRVNSGEYKLMGLAPYGEPVFREHIMRLIDLKEDGSFAMDMSYFNYLGGLTMTSHKFDQLFGGPPRSPESSVEQRHMDIARSIQDVTEEIVLRMARHVRAVTGERYICLAGGVALNCVSNGKLLREKIFDDIWIQPAAGDAGGALGAALAAHYEYCGHERIVQEGDVMRGSYLGSAYGEEEIVAFLKKKNIPYVACHEDELSLRVAELLAKESVVGWFQGRMEFGPRALGNRSILGDPRSPRMQSVMNLKIKFRESFRPFAPAVLADYVGEYFDLAHESPYMLIVAPVEVSHRRTLSEEDMRKKGIDLLHIPKSDIPAVTHVDYTARIQTVHSETNARFASLIRAFYERTKCPVVVNTSFNVRGEPIVESLEDAYRCFMRTEMDVLVLGNCVLLKSEQPQSIIDESWKNEYALD